MKMKEKLVVHPQTLGVDSPRLILEKQLDEAVARRNRLSDADKAAQRLFDKQEADNVKRVAFAKEFAIQWRWRLKELIK